MNASKVAETSKSDEPAAKKPKVEDNETTMVQKVWLQNFIWST